MVIKELSNKFIASDPALRVVEIVFRDLSFLASCRVTELNLSSFLAAYYLACWTLPGTSIKLTFDSLNRQSFKGSTVCPALNLLSHTIYPK